MTTSERYEVERVIAAEPAAIFRVLSDPQGHVSIDASGMLMDATGEPARAVGDREIFPIISETALRATLGILDRTVTRTRAATG